MKLLRLLPLFATLLPLPAQGPSGDPAAAPEGEAKPRQVSIQLDWIKLPHLTANQLLRRHLQHSTDGDALYAAVQELILQKKAERMDLNCLLVRGGQRSKVEAVIEKPYPTEFDPPQVGNAGAAGDASAAENVAPTTPNSFTWRNTGHTAEVEATVGEDGHTIDLNLAPQWVEHLTDWTWGKGVSEIKRPVFGTDKVSTQLLCGNGEWELAGLFTPPWLPEDGKPPGSAPLPGDRVFLFVRAASDPLPKANEQVPASSAKQVTVLAEWIETDTATASTLLAQHPAFADSTTLREALEPMLTDGRALLLESAALPIRGGQRSKIESITEFAYPTQSDPPQFAGSAHGPANQVPAPQTRTSFTPVCHQSFVFRNLGTTMEMEATVGESGNVIDLNCAPELVFNLGSDSFGQGVAEIKQPRFQSMRTTCQLAVLPGAPSMIAAFDAPVTDGKPQPHARPRKVLLFIRAIP